MHKKGFTPLEINESKADGIVNASAVKIPKGEHSLSLTGFTFVELLVSILIFSIIVVSLYSTFRVGLTAYRKGEREVSLSQKLRLCLDQMALDFRNSYKFSDTQSGFKSQDGKISFYCLKKINSSENKPKLQICRIEYSLDQDKLLRAIFSGKLAFSDRTEAKNEMLLSNISKLAIEFPYKQEGAEAIAWKDYWLEPDELPLGIRINLEIKDPRNPGQALKMGKFIYLPLGKLGNESAK